MIARERLLDIAEDLISRRGYAGTSVSEIVGAADVGPPTLYWHFKNKAGILEAVMQRGAERLGALPTWEELPDGTPRARFLAAMRMIGKNVSSEPQFVRLLMLLALERGEHDRTVMRTIRSIRKRSRTWIIGILQAAWPMVPLPVAESMAYKMMTFADGWAFRQIIEPKNTTGTGFDWMFAMVANEAESIAGTKSSRT